MIWRHVQTDCDFRAKIFDRLKLKTRQFDHCPSVVRRRLAKLSSGVPIFPPTCVGIPAFFSSSPIRAVVVVLPFEPVMPTIRPFRNRYASSTSPMTSPSFRSTYRAGIVFVGTPGEITTRSIWSSSHDGMSPAIRPTSWDDLKPRAASDQLSTSFLSCRATTAPRADKNFADATPDFPAPRTNTFLL